LDGGRGAGAKPVRMLASAWRGGALPRIPTAKATADGIVIGDRNNPIVDAALVAVGQARIHDLAAWMRIRRRGTDRTGRNRKLRHFAVRLRAVPARGWSGGRR